jgi:hypothetical protein
MNLQQAQQITFQLRKAGIAQSLIDEVYSYRGATYVAIVTSCKPPQFYYICGKTFDQDSTFGDSLPRYKDHPMGYIYYG